MICEKCGVDVRVSDWPFCPHGQGANAVAPDDIPGGQWFDNGFSEPRKFYSHSAHRAALAAEGLEIRAKWAGPNDKHLTNWAAGAVDLTGAEAFVRSHYADRWPAADTPITVTDLETTVKASDLAD